LGKIRKERKDYIVNTLGMKESGKILLTYHLPTKHTFTGKKF